MRPFENLTVTANYFRFDYSSNFQSNVLKIPEWGYGNFFTGPTFDDSGTIFQSANFQVPAAGSGGLVVPDRPPCPMETPTIARNYNREKTRQAERRDGRESVRACRTRRSPYQ